MPELTNSICAADQKLANVAKTIEQFVARLNGKASQGVPVGPAASIIFTESVLTDIDELLSTRGLTHLRYVDDIRVFSNSEETLEILLEELAQHLFDEHRLQLAAPKTRIMASSEFAKLIVGPEDLEKKELLEVASAVSDYGAPYTPSDLDDLVKKYLEPEHSTQRRPRKGWFGRMLDTIEHDKARERNQVRTALLKEILSAALTRTPIDLGLTRHALRQARRWANEELVEDVLGNISALEPATAETFLYLQAVSTPTVVAANIDRIRALLVSPTFKRSRFARHWTYWYITSTKDLVRDAVIGPAIWKTAPVEWQMRAARTTRNLANVRKQKSGLASLGAWDRRAVLFASEVMPLDERNPWLSTVTPRDFAEQCIIEWAKSQP
jgi:hypothetical protein